MLDANAMAISLVIAVSTLCFDVARGSASVDLYRHHRGDASSLARVAHAKHDSYPREGGGGGIDAGARARRTDEGERGAVRIDLHLHILLLDEANGDDVDEATIDKQMTVLNEAFGGVPNSLYDNCFDGYNATEDPPAATPFSFDLAEVTRSRWSDVEEKARDAATVDEVLILYLLLAGADANEDDLYGFAVKSKAEQIDFIVDEVPAGADIWPAFALNKILRRGDCSTLNVYVLPQGLVDVPYMSYGFAMPPFRCGESDVLGTNLDMVYIHRATLPDASFPEGNPNRLDNQYLNEGDTLVHETGHWLGLLHTFGGPNDKNGCSMAGGDNVRDTPAQEVSGNALEMPGCPFDSSGPCCPAERNTCEWLPGNDPVWNFMDYVSDCCMHSFSPDQADRMEYHWWTYRATPSDGEATTTTMATPSPPTGEGGTANGTTTTEENATAPANDDGASPTDSPTHVPTTMDDGIGARSAAAPGRMSVVEGSALRALTPMIPILSVLFLI